MEGSAPPAVYVVRVWLVTPPLAGVSHPKSAILRLANAQRGALALRARKVTAAGAMRVIARGVSEIVAAFRSGLHKKVQELWKCSELEVTAEDRAELEGGGCLIQPSASAVAGGAGSSGGPGFPPAAAASEASSVDTGSNASSALIVQEVRLERERGERAAAAREDAAREAVAAAEASAREAVAAAEASAREAVAAAKAAEERESATRDKAIAALMKKLNLTRADAEDMLH